MIAKKQSPLKTAVHATLHCLTGCVVGEVVGLIIGVQAGFSAWGTMLLATALAYIVGFTLSVRPLIKAQQLSLFSAVKVIWLGEVLSIGAMEIAMNGFDYWIGGAQANSIMEPIFWIAMLVAIPAGFLAALPVNYWLLKRELKSCCHH